MADDTASVVAGAIPVVGGLISGLINNADTSANNAANRAFQEQQQDKQNAYNLQMWQMQTDYNSPQSVMNRYISAGLNPNLIYGAATGNLAAPPAQSAKVEYVAQPQRAPDLGGLSAAGLAAYNNTRLAGAQVNNMQAQNTNITEDTALKIAQTAATAATTAVTQAGLPFTADRIRAEINNTDSQTNKNNTDANVNSMLAPFQADLASANTRKSLADAISVLDSNERAAAMQAPNLAAAVQSVINLRTANMRDQAQIANLNAATKDVLGSAALKSFQVNLANQGVAPGSSLFTGVVGRIVNAIGNTNLAGGAHSQQPKPVNDVRDMQYNIDHELITH